MALIGVIVPVYKVEPYIHRCVDSILVQTYRDFELILVDDGSPDNCGAICDQYARQDRRVHVIHQQNGGLSAARNAGIDWAFANSDSQWLTFIDSDDWVHPEMLERLLADAERYNVNVSVCGYALTEGETLDVNCAEYQSQIWEPEDFFIAHNTNAVIACAKLYRKKCFSEIRYPIGKIHEDEFTTYKILFAEQSIAVSHMPMYFYFQNAGGITLSAWTPKRLDAVDALEEQADYFRVHGYRAAYFQSATFCADVIIRSRTLLEGSKIPQSEKECFDRLLKKRLRKVLIRFRDVLSFGKNKWLYESAFPVPMMVYWKAAEIYGRMKSLFGGK